MFNFTSLFSYKLSWDFDKKSKCDNILKTCKITFQVSDTKGRQFLNLLDNFYLIESLYIKEGL